MDVIYSYREKFENMLIDANVIINNDLMYNTKDLTTWIEVN